MRASNAEIAMVLHSSTVFRQAAAKAAAKAKFAACKLKMSAQNDALKVAKKEISELKEKFRIARFATVHYQQYGGREWGACGLLRCLVNARALAIFCYVCNHGSNFKHTMRYLPFQGNPRFGNMFFKLLSNVEPKVKVVSSQTVDVRPPPSNHKAEPHKHMQLPIPPLADNTSLHCYCQETSPSAPRC
jgi:hypothetical protein